MSFFKDLPASPERPRQPKHVSPVWSGPPSDELPAVVSLGQFFHRSTQIVMAAKSVEVFSTGCLIETVVSIRRADESDSEWSRITERCFNHPSYMLDSQNGREGALQFGVALSDGQKATTAQVYPAMFEGTEPIAGPVLISAGGGGGSGSEDELVSSSKFWLWPLPLGGDVHFVAQWDDLGIKEGSVLITGEQLGTAVADVQKYWVVPGTE